MAKDEKVFAEAIVCDIRRQTRRRYSAEEKIRIVLEGLRGEDICKSSKYLGHKWNVLICKRQDFI